SLCNIIFTIQDNQEGVLIWDSRQWSQGVHDY
ncbi:MAG: hypothetical protein ACI8RD_012794, partial [Bacillariaceae sp.]